MAIGFYMAFYGNNKLECSRLSIELPAVEVIGPVGLQGGLVPASGGVYKLDFIVIKCYRRRLVLISLWSTLPRCQAYHARNVLLILPIITISSGIGRGCILE